MTADFSLRLALAGIVLLLAGCANHDRPPEPADVEIRRAVDTRGKNGVIAGDELRRLFSDVTAYGELSSDHSQFIRYYAADGRVIDLHPVRGRREGRWQVRDDQLCIRWDGPQNCTRVIRQDNRLLLQQTLTSDATHEAARIERLLRGNPELLQ